MTTPRARRWCFTSFKDDFAYGKERAMLSERIRFIICQKESCPDTSRVHFQGYVAFKRPIRMTSVKTILGDDSLHLEVSRGTEQDSVNYCSKEDTRIGGPWSYGERQECGTRNDLNEVKEMIKDGKSNLQVAELIPFDRYCRNYKAFDSYRHLFNRTKQDWRQLSVYWIWGEAGTGKSRWAWASAGLENIYLMTSNIWADGYEAQEILLLDDWTTSQFPLRYMLQLMDGHPLPLQTKGGWTFASWTTVIITTNFNPEEIYTEIFERYPKRKDAFMRRITSIVEMKEGTIMPNIIIN